MSRLYIVVDEEKSWSPYYPSEDLITVSEYLTNRDIASQERMQVINLCADYRYLSNGYYCSLLAEARGHKIIPSVRTMNDLSHKVLYALDLDELTETIQKTITHYHEEHPEHFSLKIFFGMTKFTTLQNLAKQLFDLFPCPILELTFAQRKADLWDIETIQPTSISSLTELEQDEFAAAFDRFSHQIWRKPRSRKSYRYDVAVLINPEEKLPPSNKKAIQQFIRVGKQMGLQLETITPQDFNRLAEYDALFIRETTSLTHHTYQFAKKAESEDMVVIDDPSSILKCTNKIYLSELLQRKQIKIPKTVILNRMDLDHLPEKIEPIGFPAVIKIPDGSFSLGVFKAKTMEDLYAICTKLFQQTSLLLLQEYIFTEYDWRIGVLNQKPLYACQYFMSKGHWQIYKHDDKGKTVAGGFKTWSIHQAPQEVVKAATKAANLIGDSLYGVDIKQVEKEAYVIEVNDNPNIDAGVEDGYLGEDLYRYILEYFLSRLEEKRHHFS